MNTSQKYYLIGICGTAMASLAGMLQARGCVVEGSDSDVYPPMSDFLERLGIRVYKGYRAENLAASMPDTVVIGNALSRGNPEVEAVLDSETRYASMAETVKELFIRGKNSIVVAGTHGKTTTTALMAWALEQGGRKPSFLVGGIAENFGKSFQVSTGPDFVIEGDEYDTAFFDKRSKFVHYPARTAILNNLEFDHADIFPDLAAIETQFHHFVRTLPASGLVVANGADAALARVLARGCYTPVERFGVADGWAATTVAGDGFEVLWRGEKQGRVRWTLQGAHNQANALAAIAAARHCGVAPAQAITALGGYQGVKRRMEVRGVAGGVTVYDDFAHHPTAIAATLEGLRARVRNSRILALLEPRSNTMKAGVMKDRLAASLAGADRVYCYSAGLQWDATAALAQLGAKAEIHADFGRLLEAVSAEAKPGDHVVIMSNGGFNGIHEKLLARLAKSF